MYAHMSAHMYAHMYIHVYSCMYINARRPDLLRPVTILVDEGCRRRQDLKASLHFGVGSAAVPDLRHAPPQNADSASLVELPFAAYA